MATDWFAVHKQGLAAVLARRGMEFAVLELIQRGTRASRGLAFVNWLAGLRLWRRHDGHRPRASGSHRPLAGARRHTAAGPHRNRSRASAGAHRVAAAGGSYARTR